MQGSFQVSFQSKEGPDSRTIKAINSKFNSAGFVQRLSFRRSPTVRTPDKVAEIESIVEETPTKSVRKISSEVQLSYGTTRSIMKDDLSLHPYKPIVTQGLKADDFPTRLSYSNWFLSEYQQNPGFLRNLLFTDEALFHLNGMVNKQNVRFWSTDNPKELQETKKFSPHVNVWIAIGARHIFGPYFFFEEEGATVTTNTDQHASRYIKMLKDKFFVDLKRKGYVLKNTYFQQDNSRVHTAKTTLDFLKTKLNPEKKKKHQQRPLPRSLTGSNAPRLLLIRIY